MHLQAWQEEESEQHALEVCLYICDRAQGALFSGMCIMFFAWMHHSRRAAVARMLAQATGAPEME
eukprot:COSAG02_NODE_49155_length_328_cov_1.362445_1_plen_64_part_01